MEETERFGILEVFGCLSDTQMEIKGIDWRSMKPDGNGMV
jgi:hypothetical protein